MKTAQLFILALAILVIGSPVIAQSDKLTEADYNSVLAKALDAASSRDRRILTDETYYTGSQVTGTRKIVSDFVGPDAKRVNVTEDFKEKRSSSDAIAISGQFFCRDGVKGWKRADKECAKAGKAMAIPDGDYEYFVEPDPNAAGRKIYTRRAAYADSGSAQRDAVRLKFIEIKFVTDESGLILEYTETRRGGVEPNGWSSTQVTRYEYDPAGLKIVDPTKTNL